MLAVLILVLFILLFIIVVVIIVVVIVVVAATVILVEVCTFKQVSMFAGIGTFVLEVGLDELFNSPAMQKSLEVSMACSSLGDPCKSDRDEWERTYCCNDLDNHWLGLTGPWEGAIQPSPNS